MSLLEPPIDNPDPVIADYLNRLQTLITLVQSWVEPAGWESRLKSKTFSESGLGEFEVPLLELERRGVEVVLVPLRRKIPGDDGTVDLYVMPGYDDLATLRDDGSQWSIGFFHPPQRTVPRFVIEAGRLPFDAATLNRVLDTAVDA